MNRHERRVPKQQHLSRVSTAFYSLFVLAAMGGGYLLFRPQPPPPSAGSKSAASAQTERVLRPDRPTARCQQPPTVPITNGLSMEDRERFYHLTEGSEYFWLPILRALASPASLDGKVSGHQSFLDNPERFGLLADPNSKDGLPVGMAVLPSNTLPDQRFPLVGFNCAACHVGELHYKGETLRVDGAPSTFFLGQFIEELLYSITRTRDDPQEFARFLERLAPALAEHASQASAGMGTSAQGMGSGGSKSTHVLQQAYPASNLGAGGPGRERDRLREELTRHSTETLQKSEPSPAEFPSFAEELRCQQITSVKDVVDMLWGYKVFFKRLLELNQQPSTPPGPGPGRADAFGAARGLLFRDTARSSVEAPVSFPHLWGLKEQAWFQWDGSTSSIMERSIGEALGMGAFFNHETYESTIQLRHLGELNALAGKLQAPCWPPFLGKPDPARVTRGERLFTQHCARCHSSPAGIGIPVEVVGTDRSRLDSFQEPLGNGAAFHAELEKALRRIKEEAFKRQGVAPWEFPEPSGSRWRSEPVYLAKPLAGIWATAPYLHNGSVPTLWDLLQPASRRPKRFPAGNREYDPVNLGYVLQPSGSGFVMDVSLPGNSNAGHEYGTDLKDEQKRDLLEYLKAL